MRRRVRPPTFDDLMRIPADGEFAAWALERWGADALINPVIYECGHGDDRIGLGDLVKRLTNALGFETCSACEARRRSLNRFSVRRFRRRPRPSRCPSCGGLRA